MTDGILKKADELIHGKRQDDYGHPLDNYMMTAALMNAYLWGRKVANGGEMPLLDEHDVVRFFQFAKMSREVHGRGLDRNYVDNELDIVGYSGLRQMMVEEYRRRCEETIRDAAQEEPFTNPESK